ncbi:MAG: knotted carbamoyltransferase YgeW [Deltaproteobacteria bacterium]|nr:knotted carbamoyltransferase YgeW [Deltaproteobacteria bacterium]
MSTREQVEALLTKVAGGVNTLYDSDFLLTWERSRPELELVLSLAEALQQMVRAKLPTRVFDGRLGMSIFRDKSTRTRYAFRSGCSLLGLNTEELSEEHSQIAHGETVRETAAMISFLSEVVGIRDDQFLGEGHAYMKEVGASLKESYEAGVLPQRTTVVNLQCDLDHPTQSLSDLRHLMDEYGGLEALRGKKLAMTWAYSPSYGKPLSVPQGIVGLMSRFGMDVVLAHPEGYELEDEPLAAARRFSGESGGSFSVAHSMEEAFEGADIIYPKSWAPARVMRERTRLLRAGEGDALDALEKDCLAQNAQHKAWEADEKKLALTREGEALYMHCLPADISGVSCERGEVTEGVFERYRLKTYAEAAHKPYIIAAMILATRFTDPGQRLLQGLPR